MHGKLALLLSVGKLKQQPVLPTFPAVTHGLAQLRGGCLVATAGTVNATLTARGRSVYPGVSMNLSSLFWSQCLLCENEAKGGEM